MGAETRIVDVVVLALLARGARVARSLSKGSRDRGLVYLALRRLERDGLITSTPLRASRRRDRLYRVTGSGREALRVWRLSG